MDIAVRFTRRAGLFRRHAEPWRCSPVMMAATGTGKLAVAYEAARCHARAAFCITGPAPRWTRPCAWRRSIRKRNRRRLEVPQGVYFGGRKPCDDSHSRMPGVMSTPSLTGCTNARSGKR
jgi:hypothetical protein